MKTNEAQRHRGRIMKVWQAETLEERGMKTKEAQRKNH
jgi:hypothetical protein